MGTGNSSVDESVFRKRLHLLPDRAEELSSLNIRSYLEISRHGISMLRVDASLRKALTIEQYEFPFTHDNARWASVVKQVLGRFDSMDADLILVDGLLTSVIPADVNSNDEHALKALLLLEHGLRPDTSVIRTPLEAWDALCISLIPSALLRILPNTRIMPSLGAWMPSLLRRPTAHHMHLHVTERDFQIALLAGRNLLLHNTFVHDGPSDVLYFTLATLEQMSILHTDVAITLYGKVTKGDAMHELLSKYVTRINFGEKPTELTYSYAFKDFEDQAFPFILNAPLCAS